MSRRYIKQNFHYTDSTFTAVKTVLNWNDLYCKKQETDKSTLHLVKGHEFHDEEPHPVPPSPLLKIVSYV